MPTSNPVPSEAPEDLLFNAKKTDEFINSDADSFTDRLGRVKLTYKAILSNAQQAIAEAILQGDATAIALATLYDTIEQGRNAVPVGASFRVRGAGDVAAYEYRKTGENTQTLLAVYYSETAILNSSNSILEYVNSRPAIRNILTQDNGFAIDFTDIDGERFGGFDKRGGLLLSYMQGRALQDLMRLTDGGDLLLGIDDADQMVLKLDSDGRLAIAGLANTVQQTISNIQSDDLFHFHDDNGSLLIRMASDGQMYVVGLDKSIQELLGGASSNRVFAGALRGPLESFSEPSTALLTSGGGDGVPPMYCQLPTRRTLGSAWQGNVFTTENSPIDIKTPYDPKNGVVHPYLMEFYNGWRGYRYIMGLTGYTNTNENEENPFIVASNDLRNWDLITPILADRPDVLSGHNSDIALAYDPRSRELIMVYRQTIRLDGPGSPSNRTEDALWCRRTRDGVAWTDAVRIFGPNLRSVEIVLSPTFVFDPAQCGWHMYCVSRSSGGKYELRHYASTKIEGPWVHDVDIITPPEITAWHCDVRWVGNRLVALMHDNTAGNLYFGVATAGSWTDFTFSTVPVITNPLMGMYKASFLPVFNDAGQIAFDIAWTSNDSVAPADRWKLYINRTNFAAIS